MAPTATSADVIEMDRWDDASCILFYISASPRARCSCCLSNAVCWSIASCGFYLVISSSAGKVEDNNRQPHNKAGPCYYRKAQGHAHHERHSHTRTYDCWCTRGRISFTGHLFSCMGLVWQTISPLLIFLRSRARLRYKACACPSSETDQAGETRKEKQPGRIPLPAGEVRASSGQTKTPLHLGDIKRCRKIARCKCSVALVSWGSPVPPLPTRSFGSTSNIHLLFIFSLVPREQVRADISFLECPVTPKQKDPEHHLRYPIGAKIKKENPQKRH